MLMPAVCRLAFSKKRRKGEDDSLKFLDAQLSRVV